MESEKRIKHSMGEKVKPRHAKHALPLSKHEKLQKSSCESHNKLKRKKKD